jgi:hypothetical protein
MKVFVVCFLIVCVVVIGVFFATPSTQGQKEQEEEATVVQKGQVTEKEREYSKEYKNLYSLREGRKLGELRGGKKDVSVISDEPEFVIDPHAPIVTVSEFFKGLSCSSDAIVVGSVKSKSSHLTEDETFVYTEYVFSIKDVVKDNISSPIKLNSNIEIARPGGVIKLDNRRITVEDKSYETLKKNEDYLLFLHFVASTKGYVVASNQGDFILEGNSFKNLSKTAFPKELENSNLQDLLSNIRSSISIGCNQNSEGDY